MDTYGEAARNEFASFNASETNANVFRREPMPIPQQRQRREAVPVTKILPVTVESEQDTTGPACRRQGVEPEWFFPEKENARRHARAAKAVCALCPVQVECLEGALERKEAYGIWGGLSERERRRLRRR